MQALIKLVGGLRNSDSHNDNFQKNELRMRRIAGRSIIDDNNENFYSRELG
ncbi:1408_t:CDS:2, partial [Rhizophagus irregularis]